MNILFYAILAAAGTFTSVTRSVKPECPPRTETGTGRPPATAASVRRSSLAAHNAHRSNHSAAGVTWDSKLAEYATTLADTCNYGHDTSIGGGGYGQNIAMSAYSNFATSDSDAAARAITRQWYNNEFDLYPGYDSEPPMENFKNWGHLSQIVWQNTKAIGCAVAICEPGTLSDRLKGYFAVCNYFPQGNIPNDFINNVSPPTGDAVITIE